MALTAIEGVGRPGVELPRGPVRIGAVTPEDLQRLRMVFESANYTVDAVVELIGEPAHRALARNSTVPARRALGERDDALSTLTKLWLVQAEVSRTDVDRALPGLLEPLAAAGILTIGHEPEGVDPGDVDTVRAAVDVRPYAADDRDLWIFSDLTPGLDGTTTPIDPDFVLGVSAASSTLAQLTLRRPAARALDLGTGCGVQSLHLADHVSEIVATDVNPRALDLARLTFALNGVEVGLRSGSLFDPVAEERFDLIVTNPPYVMSPPNGTRLSYRESSMPADALVEHVVRHGADRLAPDGVLHVLANWAHPVGGDWQERLRGWVTPSGCDAHVMQREVLEPSTYVEIWLADAGLLGAADYTRRYDAWLDYFEVLGIEAVGMGWILLHRSGRDQPTIRIEDWPHAVEQPIAPAYASEIAAQALLSRLSDDQVLARRWRLASDIVEETHGAPGSPDPQAIVFRQQRGFRRAIRADTALAATLGACDGDLTLGQILDAVALLSDVTPQTLRRQVLPRVRELVGDGFFLMTGV